jgi:exodeoxyribonuclease VII large subunit
MFTQAINLKYERLSARLQNAVQSKIFKEPSLIFMPKEQYLDDLMLSLQKAVSLQIKNAEQNLKSLRHRLIALSPSSVLKRGYAIVRRLETGELTRTSQKGEKLTVETSRDFFEVETI